jgi:regulator of sirC expression with transglutaminase-like and TPR domain
VAAARELSHEARDCGARAAGIPITLSIVAIEVARHAGLTLAGVSFPGHFLARTADEPPVVLDAFHGRLVDREGLAVLLRRALGADAPLEPAHLASARPRDVVVRMLSNLKHGYASRRDWLRALECCDHILLVAPDAASELRDRGLLYEQLECFGPARDDLERYLDLVRNTPEADALRARVDVIRMRASHIH